MLHQGVCTNVSKKKKDSFRANKNILSTKQHTDRNLQFGQIVKVKKQFLEEKKPVISIDTKKKELIGLFK